MTNPAKRSTHSNSPQVVSGVEETVVHVPRLTVKKLADKLVEISGNKDEKIEIARLGMESLDYVKICNLCLDKHPDNKPDLMPSRFMILYGASDADLEAKKHLDDNPYPLQESLEEKVSIERLAFHLGILGWYQGPWKTPPEDWDDDVPKNSNTLLEGQLFAALCAYIENATPALDGDLRGGTYAASAGESLSDIAEANGIREWRLLWQLNQSALETDSDVLKKDAVLALPDEKSNPLVDWFKENQWDDFLNPDMGYQNPGKYLSLTFLDVDDTPLVFQDANGNSVSRTCEVYATAPIPTLLCRIPLKAGNDLDVVVPDTEDIGIWVENEAIGYGGTIWPPFDQFRAPTAEPATARTTQPRPAAGRRGRRAKPRNPPKVPHPRSDPSPIQDSESHGHRKQEQERQADPIELEHHPDQVGQRGHP
jgi:hypothetical protein